ncbi:MAG: hypothetical protein RSB82_04140 [Victivallaceae bacterium]
MSSSSETTNSGGKANHTGNQLERFVEQALQSHSYTEFWNHKAQAFDNRKSIGGKQYLKQLPCGRTIYQTVRKVDFLVINRAKFPDDLIIECKWQQSKGSVDEKYPFLLYNIINTGIPTVILLDGEGYSAAAKKWLTDQADKEMNLSFWGLWTMTEFQKNINNGFLG